MRYAFVSDPLYYIESISYISVIIGILRAGCIAFPISPRNSAGAVAHLLSTTSVSCVLVSSESAVRTLFSESISLMRDGSHIQEVSMPTYHQLFHLERGFKWVPMKKPDINATACIYHSSG